MRKRRAIVFAEDFTVSGLFKDFFSSLGYDVLAFTEPEVCPVYSADREACSRRHPCADVILADFNMPRMNGVELLWAQAARGCMLTPLNKALVSARREDGMSEALKRLGSAFFERPLDMKELEAWVRGCEQRMDLTRPLGDRRREPRTPLPGITCRVTCAKDLLTCFIHDISPNGFCLDLPVALEREMSVQVTSDHTRAPRPAVVQWRRKQENGFYHTGLKCR